VDGAKPGSKEPPHVPGFATALASAPKQLAPDEVRVRLRVRVRDWARDRVRVRVRVRVSPLVTLP